jgi:hypothetical protein
VKCKIFIKARLSKVLLGLVVTVCPTLIGPGEVDDGNLEEGVANNLLVIYTFIWRSGETYLLSWRPARALYQAMNAAKNPNNPAAF